MANLCVPRAEAESKIQKQIDAGTGLLTPKHGLDEWKRQTKRWKEYTTELLSRLFSDDQYAKEFKDSGGTPFILGDASLEIERKHETLKKEIDNLGSLLNRLDLIPEPKPEVGSAETQPSPSLDEVALRSRKVFIVHGHDEALKQEVARILEKLELEPIILAEQPNQGKTLIEKFEAHTDVSFAIVLLTPDDVGRASGDNKTKDKPRARQNVILELGYFVGKLGRERVGVLYKMDVELPSDIHGILYIPANDDSWHLKLAKEMKTAGLNIDLNNL